MGIWRFLFGPDEENREKFLLEKKAKAQAIIEACDEELAELKGTRNENKTED